MTASLRPLPKARLAAENETLRREIAALRARLGPAPHLVGPRPVDGAWDVRFAEILPDAVMVVCGGTIVAANSACVRQFGAERAEDLIGRSNLDFIHSDERDSAREHMAETLRAGRLNEYLRRRRLRLDGSEYLGEVAATPYRWGDEDAILVVVRDLTDRLRTSDELTRTQALLADAMSSVTDGVAIFDAIERYVFSNAKFLANDPARTEILRPGIKFEDFIRGTLTHNRKAHAGASIESQVQQRVRWFRTAGPANEFSNGTRWFLVTHRRMPSGYTVILNTDITERKRDQQEAEKTAERLRILFEASPDAIYVQRQGVFQLLNPAAVKLLGARSADDVIGRLVLDTYHAEERDRMRQVLSDHPRNWADTPPSEHRRVRFDGSEFWADVTVAPVNWEGDDGTVVFLRDTTHRKRLREAYEQQQSILREAIESISEGLWVFDREQKLVISNARLRDLAQYPAELLAPGTRFETIMRYAVERGDFGAGEPERLVAERLKTVEATEPFMFERSVPDGKTLEVRYSPMPGGGFVCTFADITARKHSELELGEMTARLIAQHRELQRSNEELEQFAYVASHDLQEPLRSIGSYCQLLQRRYKGRLDKDADEFIDFAVEGAKRMQVLINDLLKYSRVGTRGKPFEPTDCNKVFAEAVSNLHQAIADAGAEVTAGEIPVVFGDGVQLCQLFQNLIANAIKFRGEAPPKVRVTAAAVRSEVVFSVTDNGIGIDPRHADRIFQIFQRLHERGKYPGTGIGLAVCKKIVARHGGRIWVDSAPGRGSAFRFVLGPKGNSQEEKGT